VQETPGHDNIATTSGYLRARLAVGQNDARQSHATSVRRGIANDGKGFFTGSCHLAQRR